MSIFINGLGCISPQKTYDNSVFLEETLSQDNEFLVCNEPNYKNFIHPVLLRRTSKIMKMGISSALISMIDSGIEKPDSIISGTSLGCIEDTETFLNAIIDNGEKLLTPTAFIQSTHNTINSQIAIILKANGYNFTYVHRGFSFESALADGILQINEGEAKNVLVGGYDEMTENYYEIYKKLMLWKEEPINHLELLKSETTGTISGQGSAFFVISDEQNEKTYCELKGVTTMFEPFDVTKIRLSIEDFLRDNNMDESDIDLCIFGRNGDSEGDRVYQYLEDHYFQNQTITAYKHLCGEYQTSSAFALWLGSNMLKRQVIPEVTLLRNTNPNKIKNVLIYNHYNCTHHSLYILTKC